MIMIARRSTKRGFALVLVLLVLVLAGSYLGLAAHRSGKAALAAASAQEELQLKWAFLSARAAALPAVERLLEEQLAISGRPASTARVDLTLNGRQLTIVAGDEQAKANANMLLERHGMRSLIDTLRSLQADQREALAVEPRPAAEPPANLISRWPQRFAALGQLFAPGKRMSVPQMKYDSCVNQHITCWGSGAVNILRADALVLRATLGDLLNENEIDQLLKWRLDNPQGTVDAAMESLEIEKKRRESLRRLLTSRSYCHSIWLVVRSGSRDWQRLYVNQQGDAENDSQEWTFLW